ELPGGRQTRSNPLVSCLPSNEFGSSHAAAACIIVTSRISKTSSALWKPNLRTGQLATKFYVGYAQLLKTLCLDVLPAAEVMPERSCSCEPLAAELVGRVL